MVDIEWVGQYGNYVVDCFGVVYVGVGVQCWYQVSGFGYDFDVIVDIIIGIIQYQVLGGGYDVLQIGGVQMVDLYGDGIY